MNENAPQILRWDLPVRLFHGLLIVLIALQYLSGEFDLLPIEIHFWLGYATLALILFRIGWGFFGSENARFAGFVRGPRAIMRYLRSLTSSARQYGAGHNPLGGWSVLAMLGCVLLQAVTGLFSADDIGDSGPLAGLVSEHTVKLMTRLHHLNQNLLLGLIALHLAAVLFYQLVLRQNLITPMIFTDGKTVPDKTAARTGLIRAAVILLFAIAVVGAVVWYGGNARM